MIGRRDKLVTLQTPTMVEDDYGGETPSWGPIGGAAEPTKEWAAVFYGKGDERRQAAIEQGRQPATFQVLSNTLTRAVKLEDRIVHNSSNWDIEGIAPDFPKPGHIEFTAVRAL